MIQLLFFSSFNTSAADPVVTIILLVIALIGGFCITTIGPGGIFVTIALFALLPLDPSTVAGTASATFIVTGIAGSLGYLRSGQLLEKHAIKAAVILSLTSIVGAFAGSQLNTLLNASAFAILLGIFVFFTGMIIIYRQKNKLQPDSKLRMETPKGSFLLGAVGIAVGLPGGLLGVGGPVLAVPLLVVLGVPMLMSVALAQVQSVFISGMATAGYAMYGAVDWLLAVYLTIPLLTGAIAGWYSAQKIRAEKLQVALAVVLIILGIYLISGGVTPGMN